MRVHAEQLIDAAPRDVFRFVGTDHFANHPRWDAAVVEMSQTSPGPMGPGTTARLVRVDGGRRLEGVATVTEYVPDRDFAAEVEFGPFRLVQRARCSPAPNGGTRLLLTIDTRARGPLRLLLPVMRPRFAATMRASLRSIKEQVEVQRRP